MDTIQVGDFFIIQRNDYVKMHHFESTKSRVWIGRDKIELESIKGHRYGSLFSIIPQKGKKVFRLEYVKDDSNFEDGFLSRSSGQDNRHITDSNVSQKLSKEAIEEMRENGKTGTEILQGLIDNSETFEHKTKFSQDKFLKKKAKKYYSYIKIRKTSIRLLIQSYYATDPIKILNLRSDSLAQLLHLSNVSSNHQVAVYDSGCQGIVVAAVLERIGLGGQLIHIYQSGSPQNQGIKAMNYSSDLLQVVHPLNLFHFRTLSSSSESEPQQILKSKVAYEILSQRSLDSLIIACRTHSKNILLTFLEYLKPSSPFVVYCPYKEPLLETYIAMKDSGRVVMASLTETWLRHYQILPERTHPEVNMSGGGGYLLSGIWVLP